MTFKDTTELLDEIRTWKNLVDFKRQKSNEICRTYNIKESQLNFLISIVSAERIKKKGLI